LAAQAPNPAANAPSQRVGSVEWSVVPPSLLRAGYRVAYVVLTTTWRLLGRAPGGVKCVILRGDDVLLVRHTYGPKRWELPGGGRRSGEQLAAAARRETREEVGADLTQWTALEPLLSHIGRAQVTLHPFVVRVEELVPDLDEVEIAQARFFPIDELPAPIGDDVPVIVAQALAA
jgi:8-oxo-dGTP pyrophosphatase MutT (NUDIX family)